MQSLHVTTAACLALQLLACDRHPAADAPASPDASAALPAASSSAVASTTPDAGTTTALTAEEQQRCAAFLADESPRRLSFVMPGDPAAHPGCTLLESGTLQCAQDVANAHARTKVQVPPARAKQVLDDAMRQIAETGCAPCPRKPSPHSYPPGYDPQSMPAQLRNRSGSADACGNQKEILKALRRELASTVTSTTRDLSAD